MKQKNSKKTHYRKVFFITFFFSLCSLVVDAGAQQTPSISRELHWAVTDERFELALERLRRGKRPQHQTPIILGHGLVVNSLFMNLTEELSLARYLAHEGFDVWNLSFRGTGRSLNPLGGGSQSWTLDDMIDKDIPAVIRHVQRATGHPKVFWVGYELGGLLFYGYLAKKEDSGVAGLVAVGAPVTFTHPEQEPMKRLLRLQESPTWRKLFLSSNASFLGRLLIPLAPNLEGLFYNPENVDEEIKGKLLEETLVDIHPGVLDHLLLMLSRGEFVSANGKFSYRKNLGKMRLPLLLIGGEEDRLAPPESIRIVHHNVRSTDRTLRIFGPRLKDSAAYGHFDLILGKKAKQEVFPFITRWLKQRDGKE